MSTGKKIGLVIVFSWFFFGGIGHFLLTEFFVSIVPPWVPWPLAAVYVSGIFELLGAIGVTRVRYRPVAGLGLIALTLAVTPANVHMWLNPEQYDYVPESLLGLRLLVQVALLWCIWWSTVSDALSRK